MIVVIIVRLSDDGCLAPDGGRDVVQNYASHLVKGDIDVGHCSPGQAGAARVSGGAEWRNETDVLPGPAFPSSDRNSR